MAPRKTPSAQQLLNDEMTSARDDLERIETDIRTLGLDDELEGKVPNNHLADSGSNVYERERLMTVREEYLTRIRMIENALERVADGSYGACSRCGQPIASARLKALPFAAYCITCQEIVDQEQAATGVKSAQPLTPSQ
jgi:RNA polymerase-binding transcription factor DksA